MVKTAAQIAGEVGVTVEQVEGVLAFMQTPLGQEAAESLARLDAAGVDVTAPVQPETRVRVAEGCYAWEVVDERGNKIFRGVFPWRPNAIAVAKLNAELRGATLVIEA